MGKITILIFITSILLFIVMCEKDSDNISKQKKIAFVRVNPGGCNGQNFNDLKSVTDEQMDTVFFRIINDTLDAFVGVNYVCCAPFTSDTRITYDSLIMTINDTCTYPYQSCYCRCRCYYTWDFFFIDSEKRKYYYKVILNDPREEGSSTFNEGMVDLSNI